MKRNYIILFFSMFVSLTVWALPVDEEKAMQLAKEFMQGSSASGMVKAPADFPLKQVPTQELQTSIASFSESVCYVFNIGEQNGFIIISGEDKLSSVVGYSDKGFFKADAMPPALKEFMESYCRYVGEIRSGRTFILNAPAKTKAATTVVEPLIKTHWNQDAPYNTMCPAYSGTGLPMYTGCVATATAQIMKYYNYPQKGEGSNSYENENYGGTISADFSQSTYDWTNMLNDYVPDNYTETQSKAVALLMRDVGIAVTMNYGPDTSGAISSNVVTALTQNFGYSKTTMLHERNHYRTEDWINLIKEELYAQRPIYYAGASKTAGHAFVCDGIDSNNYLHINWGWGGYSDGYFDMNYMNPGGLGIGGGDGSYIYYQEIITGIKPVGENEDAINTDKMTFYGGFSYDIPIYSRDSVGVYLNNLFNKSSNCYKDLLVGLSLYKNEKSYYTTAVKIDSLPAGYGWEQLSLSFAIPDTCDNGEYELRCLVGQSNRDSFREVTYPLNIPGRIGLKLNGDNVTLSLPDLNDNLLLEGEIKVSDQVFYTGQTGRFDFKVKNISNVHNQGYISMAFFSENESVYTLNSSVDAMIYQGTSIDFSFNAVFNMPSGTYTAVPYYYETDKYGATTKQILLDEIEKGTKIQICQIGDEKTFVFLETFANGIPSTFTLIDHDNLEPSQTIKAMNLGFAKGIAWRQLVYVLYGEEPMAVSHSLYEPAGQSDDWMITPAITIPNKEYDLLLGWKSVLPENGSYKVMVSTTGNTIADFQNGTVLGTFDKFAGNIEQQYIGMNAYKGQTIYIAFVNNGYNCEFLCIDDIELFWNTSLIYPAVENLKGTNQRNTVILTWDKPLFTDISVTEDQLLGFDIYGGQNTHKVALIKEEEIPGAYSASAMAALAEENHAEKTWNAQIEEASATMGNLKLTHKINNFFPGRSAVYIVIDGYSVMIPAQILDNDGTYALFAFTANNENLEQTDRIQGTLTPQGIQLSDYCVLGIINENGNYDVVETYAANSIFVPAKGSFTPLTEFTYTESDLPQSQYYYYVTSVYQNGTTANSYPIEIHIKFLLGDANNDGVVNVADIVNVINHIIGKTPEKFNAENADIDANSVIDVADVQGIVSIILGRSLPVETAQYGSYHIANNTFIVSAPERVGGFDFAYTGELRATEALKDFNITYYEKDGEKRVLAYTMGEGIDATDGINLFAMNNGLITDMKFVDTYGHEIQMNAAPTCIADENVAMLNICIKDKMLSAETKQEVVSIILYNASGIQVAHTDGARVTIDTLPQGTYVVVVKTANNVIHRKINL